MPADETPATDDRDPSALVPDAVDRALAFAATWWGWDGRPVVGGGSVWTPCKALRRTNDHLLARLASWTARQIVHHVAGIDWYAEQVGLIGGRT